MYGSALALVTRDICLEERKGSRSHIWGTRKVRTRLQGPQPTCVHITLDPVAGGAGVTQHPTSPHLHLSRDCSFGFSEVQSRCVHLCAESPASPHLGGIGAAGGETQVWALFDLEGYG